MAAKSDSKAAASRKSSKAQTGKAPKTGKSVAKTAKTAKTKKAPKAAKATRAASVKSAKSAKAAPAKAGRAKKSQAPKRAAKTQPRAKRPAAEATSVPDVRRAEAQAKKAVQARRPGESDRPLGGIAPYQPKPDEEYMGAPQMEHFRTVLSNWRHELMEQVDRTVNHLQDEASNYPDPLDRATQEEELGIELRTRDRERRLIRKISETLERIDRDDYGYCETCGVEIGLRRLEARPTATQCVDCKALDELRERQLHG